MSTCTLELPDRAPIQFELDPTLTVLDAASKAGWELPHSCRRGNCESCRVQVLDGEMTPPVQNGTALLCVSRANGDIRLAVERVEPVCSTNRKKVQAKLYRMRMAAPDVAVVDLRFPAGVKVPFKAGQYLQVHLNGAEPRSFSMSNAPKSADSVQLQVRVMPGSLFGEKILPTLQPGDLVTVELPFGDFYLREGPAPVIMVASGTGFAPIQSILEDALATQKDRSFTLYWGSRKADGLYALEQVKKWQQKFSHFRFVGVLSDDDSDHNMRKGFVHDAVLADYTNLSGHQVYVCGAPVLVSAARQAFVAQRGLPGGQFYADSFVTVDGTVVAPVLCSSWDLSVNSVNG